MTRFQMLFAFLILMLLFLLFAIGCDSSDDDDDDNEASPSPDDDDLVDDDDDQAADDDVEDDDDQDDDDGVDDDDNNDWPVYQGQGDVYSLGPLTVNVVHLAEDQNGAPKKMDIYAPTESGTYAVVIFHHGFLLAIEYFSDLLTRLASHGFVVVAPQMYQPNSLPIGKPTSYEEADEVLDVIAWMDDNLATVAGVQVDMDYLGVAGHSRGGKVAWIYLKNDPSIAKAVAGVDPVDGKGGPLGGEERVLDGTIAFGFPQLVIGTGLGPEPISIFSPACAPEGDNHVQFYNAAKDRAFHAVAVDYGHVDMLNDQTPGCLFACDVCVEGPDRVNMRKVTAGLLVAHFRATLQGVEEAFDILSDATGAPVTVELENKN